MKKGFTVVEVLIVTCIICILAAIAIPNLAKESCKHKMEAGEPISEVCKDLMNTIETQTSSPDIGKDVFCPSCPICDECNCEKQESVLKEYLGDY